MKWYVVDTHALFWYLTDSTLLGPEASRAFEEVECGEARAYVPAITVAELYYLNEKLGRPLAFAKEYESLQQSGLFTFVPFTSDDVVDFEADSAVPEMHDRIIVGIARRMDAMLLSRDKRIARTGLVPTVW